VSRAGKRKAAYEKALAQIETDQPLISLSHQRWVFACSAKIEGNQAAAGRDYQAAGYQDREVGRSTSVQGRSIASGNSTIIKASAKTGMMSSGLTMMNLLPAPSVKRAMARRGFGIFRGGEASRRS
jgi:hypothetical protein